MNISTNIGNSDLQQISSSFIDTGVFFAAFYQQDSLHVDGKLLLISAILGWFGRKIYTSTYVIDETITLTKAKLGGKEASKLADYILSSKKIEILRVDGDNKDGKKLGDVFENALEKFRKNSGMCGLSFTDCTTLGLLEKLKIPCILSFDGNFRPFVNRIFGESYRETLAQDEKAVLASAAKKLGIPL